MKNQKSKYLSLTLAIVMIFSTAYQSQSAPSLLNGDFQDLTGLTPQPGGPGWYQGVPAGWASSTGSLNYNVIDWSAGNLAANIQTLGPASPSYAPLYQSAGLLDSAGTVKLSFNILGFSTNYGMAAGIYSANLDGTPVTNFSSLASATYTESSGSLQTLEAFNVAAGTRVGVAFWRWAGSPGIDNVNLVPEPSAFSLLVAGSCLAFVLAGRRRRQSRSL
jgi:hypothetical protein